MPDGRGANMKDPGLYEKCSGAKKAELIAVLRDH